MKKKMIKLGIIVGAIMFLGGAFAGSSVTFQVKNKSSATNIGYGFMFGPNFDYGNYFNKTCNGNTCTIAIDPTKTVAASKIQDSVGIYAYSYQAGGVICSVTVPAEIYADTSGHLKSFDLYGGAVITPSSSEFVCWAQAGYDTVNITIQNLATKKK